MMQDREFAFGWEVKPSSKRSSGLLSVLKWFGNKENQVSVDADLVRCTSESSLESETSVAVAGFSTDTIASFAFVPAAAYRPFGLASTPGTFISPGPETATYRARLAERATRRIQDQHLTLRSKYNLHRDPESEVETESEVEFDRNHHSLPSQRRVAVMRGHRRTVSDLSKHKRAGAYCHVKGKRKAPQPPGYQQQLQGDEAANSSSLLRRRKRLAPPPPSNVICNDSLKLDHGILKPAKNVDTSPSGRPIALSMAAPRPWYKRTIAKGFEKKPATSEADKRKSTAALSFLTNISELDREAMEILSKGNHKTKYLKNAPAFMKPRAQNAKTDNWDSSPKRKSARDLIAKFNAISKSKPQEIDIPIVQQPEEEKEKVTKQNTSKLFNDEAKDTKTAVVKPISRSQWNCPRCTLENDYWRIICRVCSTIKPYFDDFTAPVAAENVDLQQTPYPKLAAQNSDLQSLYPKVAALFHSDERLNSEQQNVTEKMILGDEISYKEPKNCTYEPQQVKRNQVQIETITVGNDVPVEKPDYVNVNKYEEIQVEAGSNKTKIEKMILGDDISKKHLRTQVDLMTQDTKTKLTVDDEKQNSAKRDEREKLKKMLIEMKNSLPKRTNAMKVDEKQRVSLIAEQEECDEPKKHVEVLVAQTETVYENIHVRKTEAVAKVSASVQTASSAVPPKQDFQLMAEKEFAGISVEREAFVTPVYANDPTSSVGDSDTLEINRLVKRLESAIARGQLGQAAVFASELAQLKVPVNVVRQKATITATDTDPLLFHVDMYVEDKLSHRGPFPLQVSGSMTVADLKHLVADQYRIPVGVQRWILGKQLAIDETASLADHNISSTGCPVFLYLVAAPAPATTPLANPSTSSFENEPIPIVDMEAAENEDERRVVEEENIQDLWKCRACTLLNPVVTKECEVCGLIRDDGDNVDNTNNNINQTYLQLVNLDNEDLVHNSEPFECLICLTECPPGGGVILRECLHQFCRACVGNTIEYCEEAEVKCPYRDEEYACDLVLQDREVKALVPAAVYEQHLAKSVKQAETRMDNTFHCKSPDCTGWCIYEDNVNDFLCPVCNKRNCLTCQAIHSGTNCQQYQDEMRTQAETDVDARRTRAFLEDMLRRGEALACPTCRVLLLKKWGCDWLRCSMCRTEICWVTRGPRWGPAGKGDTSAGCRCGLDGLKCHPKCNYCH